MACPRCRRDNPAGAKFCLECGVRLPVGCPACGHPLPDGAKFCVECGAPAPGVASAAAGSRTPYTPRHLAERILASRSAIEGERKPVTVLFCDVVASTGLAERLGPEGMHTLLNRFFEIAGAEIHRYEGTINQFLGDGFMALFGAPLAHEDHARRAVLAALDIDAAVRGRPLATVGGETVPVTLRMGLHTGFVVVGAIGDNLRMDYTAVGDTTHLAARLQQTAEPGAIVMSDATERLVHGYVRAEPLGRTAVRGRSEPVETFRVVGRGARRSPLDRTDERPLSEFVGRARELETLRHLLDEMAGGRGQVAGVVGEPGVGKSRLLLEFRRALGERAMDYVEGRCLSFGSAIPYAPVLDVVRDVCGLADMDAPEVTHDKVVTTVSALGMDPLATAPLVLHALGLKELTDTPLGLSPEAIKTRTFDALRQLVVRSSRRRPLVVAVEDLHWIDRTSEEFFASLVEALAGVPVMLLATYRPGYRPSWMDRSYATQLSLARLGAADSLAVVRSMLPEGTLADALATLILDKAEGNPFFLEELARAVGPGRSPASGVSVPDTVHGVLTARIDRLADAPKRLLQAASVLGREFPRRLLAAVWEGGPIDALLPELTRQEFLFERTGADEPTYVFKHALTQDVAASTLLSPRRRELHRRAAEALIALDPERRGDRAPMLAHHFFEAEAWAEACEHATGAAEAATAVHANREALARYDQALAAAARGGLPALEHMRIHAARARVHEGLGHFDAARDDFEAALAIARAEQHPTACADLLGLLAELWGGHKDYQRGLELSLEAVGTAEVAGDRRTLAAARVRAGLMYLNMGRIAESRAALEQALPTFRDVDDEHGYTKTLDILAMAEGVGGDIERCIAHAREAHARYQALGDRTALAAITSTIGIWLAYGGNPEGEPLLRQAIATAVALGAASDEIFARMALSQVAVMYGAFGAASRESHLALDRARRIGHREWMSASLSVIGRLHRECGDAAGARAVHEEMLAIARELGGALWVAGALAELALDAVALGDLVAARTYADEAVAVGGEAVEFVALAWLALGEMSLAAGDAATAVDWALRVRTEAPEFRVNAADANRLAGQALAALGRSEEAERALSEARADARAMTAAPVQWRASLALADVYEARGRSDAAAAARAEALALLDRAGAALSGELRQAFQASAPVRRATKLH